jgi:hypothetical protein
MKQHKRFWLLGDSSDEEIYESLSWDLPGFTAFLRSTRKSAKGDRLRGVKARTGLTASLR